MLNKELLLNLNPKEEFCLIKFINLPEGVSLENVPENFLQIKKGLCLEDIGLGGLNFPVTSSYWIPGDDIGSYYNSAGFHNYFYPDTPVVEDIEVRVSWIPVYPAGSTVDFSITISPTTWITGYDKNYYAYGYNGYDYHVDSSKGAITSSGIELNKKGSAFCTENSPWNSEFICELYIDSTKSKGFRYGSKVVKFSPQISFPNVNLTLEGIKSNNRGSDIYIAYNRSMPKVDGYLRWSSGNTYKISLLTV